MNNNSGINLYNHAKSLIPGGNMLLSKRPEMFLPDFWPSYFSHAKGCEVWDLDNNKYIDICVMGIGTNSLGYGYEKVDEAVKNVINKGNKTPLNCPEEVELAEKLVDMHPWANMVRFARSGGEANSISIRIARAASGRDKVAICGYHGWHDWYLSSNLGDQKSLDGHLLPGLDPNGVPRNLKNTVFPFSYNNYEELLDICTNNDIGAIKMEVQRNEPPKDDFLKKVRSLASEKDIVLIFDECTSGFRETYGGLHKKYQVDPDIAIFGKALGNGYAITSIIGRSEVMEAAQSTFISSTFWTERIGPAAAIATLKSMEQLLSWEEITSSGNFLREQWRLLAKKYDIKLSLSGIPAISGFNINSEFSLEYKTLITQQMLKKGYLASNLVYLSTAHSRKVIEKYITEMEEIFSLIKECEMGRDVYELLEGPVCHSGFKRLN